MIDYDGNDQKDGSRFDDVAFDAVMYGRLPLDAKEWETENNDIGFTLVGS
jgi:hypothetical protein